MPVITTDVGKLSAVAQAFFRVDDAALQNVARAHRLHAEHADALRLKHGEHIFFEALVVSIQHVERHLHGVEAEAACCAACSIAKWIAGCLWPVKPMCRNLPAFFATCRAPITPSGANARAGSVIRMTSCTWHQVESHPFASAAAIVRAVRWRPAPCDHRASSSKRRAGDGHFGALCPCALTRALVVIPAIVEEGDCHRRWLRASAQSPPRRSTCCNRCATRPSRASKPTRRSSRAGVSHSRGRPRLGGRSHPLRPSEPEASSPRHPYRRWPVCSGTAACLPHALNPIKPESERRQKSARVNEVVISAENATVVRRPRRSEPCAHSDIFGPGWRTRCWIPRRRCVRLVAWSSEAPQRG